MFVRKAINKFKADFIPELDVPSSSHLRSSTSSSRTTSDNASLTTSLRNSANRDELPIILIEHTDSSNSNEAVSPLQKGSLFQKLVSPNQPLPSIEDGPSSHQDPSKSNLTPMFGSPIPVNPMKMEFSKITPSNSEEKRPSSSSDSNFSVIFDMLPPATPSKRVPSESLSSNSSINKVLPPDPRGNEFETESALSKGAHHDTMNEFGQPESRNRSKSPVEFSMPLNASSSKTTNGNAVSSTLLASKIPESLSNSTSPSISEIDDGPMESEQSSTIQTSQQSCELPYDDSVIQITPYNDNDQNTLETKKRLDPTPITQPFPLTSNNSLLTPNLPFFKRGNGVPGDFPLDGPSTSSSVQNPSVKPATRTFPNGNPISSKDNNDDKRVEARRTNLNSFLIALASPSSAPTVTSTQVSETVEQTKTPWRPKPSRLLQPIGETSDSMSANSSPALSPDDALARKMEELGRIRRMESRNQLARPRTSHEATSQQSHQPIRTTATPKAELRPPIHQEDSTDVAALLRAAYIERQQDLQTQLDKALAELRDVRAEKKRLTTENQSQHRSIVQLKKSLDEAKQAQDYSSVQIKNQLRDATTTLTALNKEKKGWQDKLDSMQHKLSVAERQVRCLDHLTRHKLESRQEAAYGQPKRRGLFASVPASPDVIAAMGALNEEIFQTCVQLVEGLERTSTHSTRHKSQAQKVLGDHLTAMMEDQAMTTTSGYNMLLMQTVLEVFMVHWCSSIIEAFYPSQESFADLLIQLSAQTARTTGYNAICGKQIRIVQSSTTQTDNIKFNEWVTDILKELGLILMIAGLRMKTQRNVAFSTKTLALVKAAYNLRAAMAEKDICGGLEVVVVAPDTPFQEKWMLDGHADPRKGDADRSHMDIVAGTSGIGLQRQVSEKVDGHFQPKMTVVLKPKVILTRALNVKG